MMKITLVISALLFAFQVNSQVFEEWVRRYDSQNPSFGDWAYGIASDNSNNIYVTGLVGSNTQHDIGTIKYNPNGSVIWMKQYNGTSDAQDWGYDIASDNENSVYVTGFAYDTANRDFVIIKYDSSGNQIWDKKQFGRGNLITVDHNNDIIAAGFEDDAIVIFKYNKSGNLIWSFNFNPQNTYSCFPVKIIINTGNNILIGGEIETLNTNTDFLIIKLNSNGQVIWFRTFNGPLNNDDILRDFDITSNGNIIATGGTKINTERWDFLTVKYDSTGLMQWYKIFNVDTNTSNSANVISIDSSGNSFIIGNFHYINTTSNITKIFKYNASGNLVWIKNMVFPNGQFLSPNEFKYAPDGFFYSCGSLVGLNSNSDYCTVKINQDGLIIWSAVYNGTGNNTDTPFDMTFDRNMNIYVTGTSIGATNDYCTIKYSQPIGINPISNDVPDKLYLSQNYPNPFNPTTKIKFALPPVGDAYMRPVQIVIYDILGSVVATLVNEQLKPGTYEVDWDGTKYSSGVYYYTLTAGTFSQTRKMVLIK
jgi:hypothetical protein